MDCSRCRAENRPGRRFCARCGAPLAAVCPSCGFANDSDEVFCGGCGRSLDASRGDEPGRAAAGARWAAEAERRQLTVMFCDLVGSTALAKRLGPEELREVVRAYQEAAARVVGRFDGYIAQYLGDGLLIYFGYPQAHEDDASRAVRTGLGIVEAMAELNGRLHREKVARLAVRLGIHTGLVVVGEMGGGVRHEQLALGETPNLAARLQEQAEPDTVLISDTTHRLVRGLFACRELGPRDVKGSLTPLVLHQVLGESAALSRLDVVGRANLTPLIGRERELGMLLERWEEAKDGLGQVVLLSGEAGIGKSRLLDALKERLVSESHTRWECRCSPYDQQSALYPVVEFLQRALRFQRHEPAEERLRKIEAGLERYGLGDAAAAALWAGLLSVPLPDRYAPITLTAERQKQKTLEAVLALLLAQAAERPVLMIMEDLHWVDPSTLELLALILGQVPTTSVLTILTFRPDFRPPWVVAVAVVLGEHLPVGRAAVLHPPRRQLDLALGRQVAGAIDERDGPAEVLVERDPVGAEAREHEAAAARDARRARQAARALVERRVVPARVRHAEQRAAEIVGPAVTGTRERRVVPCSTAQIIVPRCIQRLSSTAISPSWPRTMIAGWVPMGRVTKSPGRGTSLAWPTKTQPRWKMRSISSAKIRGSV